jgi:hypothetical protein
MRVAFLRGCAEARTSDSTGSLCASADCIAAALSHITPSVQVLGAEQDELDGPTFDSVEYINKKFHDEKSLDGLDDAIAKFDAEIKE